MGRAHFCTPPALLMFRALRFEPPSARKSHFPATAGAREQLCEECPRWRAVPSDSAPNTPTPQRHASDTPTPAERRRHGNGITGAERCLFSAQCQETRPGGGRAHLPGWGREGARHWSQGSLTPLQGTTQKAPTSLSAKDGPCSRALQELRTLTRLVEQSLPPLHFPQ